MSKDHIESYSSEELKELQAAGKTYTDWKRLTCMTDDEIDTSDIPLFDDTFLQNAELVRPKGKKSTTIRLDAHVLDWFKSQGKGWQTRINGVLQEYYKTHNT